MVRKRLAQHLAEGGVLPHGVLEAGVALRERRMLGQQPREVVVRGAPFSEEQAAVLVVARILDAAVERFGRIVGKLEAFVADAAGKLPGKEALEGGCLALGVVRYGHIRTGGRGARRAFSDLDAKPLREAHVRGLGEQVEPYRGDACAEAVFALVGFRGDVSGLVRMALGEGAHLTAAVDLAEPDREVVAQGDALVCVPEDLLQLIVESDGRGDPHAP